MMERVKYPVILLQISSYLPKLFPVIYSLLQATTHTVAATMQPHPIAMVPQPMPGPPLQVLPPGQIPMGVPPIIQVKQEYHPEEYGRHPTEKDAFSPGINIPTYRRFLTPLQQKTEYLDEVCEIIRVIFR